MSADRCLGSRVVESPLVARWDTTEIEEAGHHHLRREGGAARVGRVGRETRSRPRVGGQGGRRGEGGGSSLEPCVASKGRAAVGVEAQDEDVERRSPCSRQGDAFLPRAPLLPFFYFFFQLNDIQNQY